MPVSYIAVGSNIAPERNVREALRRLGEKVRLTGVSTFYRTRPIGSPGSPDFYNGIVGIETDLGARELKFDVLRGVESSLGRTRGGDRCAPRVIDLDIVIYGDAVIDEPDMTVPDPDIHTRPFVALPLLELAPGLIVPGTKTPLSDIVESMETSGMTPLPELSYTLRKEIPGEPTES